MHGTVTWATPPAISNAPADAPVLRKLEEAELAVSRGDTLSGVPLAEDALALARAAGRRDLAAEALLKLGTLRRLATAYTESAQCLIEAMQLFSVLGLEARRAEAMLQLGQAPMELGDYETALGLFKGALIIALAEDNPFLLARAYRSVGLLTSRLKNFAEAERLHRRALDHFIAIDDRTMIASAINSAALTTLQALDEAPRTTPVAAPPVLAAIEELKRARDIAQAAGNQRLVAQTLGNIGNAYGMIGDRVQNIEFERQALAVFRTLGARRDECISWGNIGRATLELGEHDEAIEALRESLNLAEQNGLKVEARLAHRLLARAFVYRDDACARVHEEHAQRLDEAIDEQGAREKLGQLARETLAAAVRDALGQEGSVASHPGDDEGDSDSATGLFTRTYLERWYRNFARGSTAPRRITLTLLAAQGMPAGLTSVWLRLVRAIERDLRVDAFGVALSPFVLLLALPEFSSGEAADARQLVDRHAARAAPEFAMAHAALWLGGAQGDSTDSLASLIRRARDSAERVGAG
jgi:tetratricopeptide (TPR) repeat protein